MRRPWATFWRRMKTKAQAAAGDRGYPTAAFALLPRRRKVATLDWDSSNHQVYGERAEGGGLRP